MIQGDASKSRVDVRIINGKARKVKIDSKGVIIGLDEMINKEVKTMGRGLKPITGKLVEVDGKLISVPDKIDQNKDKDGIKNNVDDNKDKDSATEQPTKINKTNVESTTKDEVKEVKVESTVGIKAKKVTKSKKGGKIMEEETSEQVFARLKKEAEHDKMLVDAISFAREGRDGIKEACNGIECLKNDMNKRVDDLAGKIAKIEDPSFVCENCGESRVKALSSYCPNCGSNIHEWKDDDGKPMKSWKPYWARLEANKNALKKNT